MLSVRDVTKRYGAVTALDRVSLDVAAGAFCVLLGPNGAGKSTLFQLLTGLFVPDGGEIVVAGVSVTRQPTRALARLGVVFQQQALDLDLSIVRNLSLHAALHGMPRALARSRIEEGLAQFELGEQGGRKVRELSGGNRRRVELIRAMLHRPAVLLMDEATVGLDLPSRRALRAHIAECMRQQPMAVLWATHWIEEIEDAGQVVVLHRGRVLADGPQQTVIETLGEATLEQGFSKAVGAAPSNTKNSQGVAP
jgi:ABC-2 type transport system ATP-binding protein